MTRLMYEDHAVKLLHGDAWDWLASGEACDVDAVITDPPYSERTHAGSDAATRHAIDGAHRQKIAYAPMDDTQARALVENLAVVCAGWMAFMSDDTLAPAYRTAAAGVGRMDFAHVPCLQHRPRLVGDGPGSGAVSLCVSRPRERRFLSWGSLPCWYESRPERGEVMGAKPLALMRAIVRDYTRPGDLVLDPFCGSGTTALACRMEGRRCLTIERDANTVEIARRRLALTPIETARGQLPLLT